MMIMDAANLSAFSLIELIVSFTGIAALQKFFYQVAEHTHVDSGLDIVVI